MHPVLARVKQEPVSGVCNVQGCPCKHALWSDLPMDVLGAMRVKLPGSDVLKAIKVLSSSYYRCSGPWFGAVAVHCHCITCSWSLAQPSGCQLVSTHLQGANMCI